MKQRIKQFPLTVALCFTLAVLTPSSAFMRIDQKILGSTEQGAKKNISTITNFDEAMLQNYIDQFETNGETKMIDGLRSWQTIRGDVGDVAVVDDVAAREVDDDNTLVVVKTHCSNHKVVAYLGCQVSSGDITGLGFSKAETLGEKFGSTEFNLIIRMGAVFAVLIFIIFLISRFKYIYG